MAELKTFLSRIKLVYQRTTNATKVMLIVAIILSMGALITLRLSMTDIQGKTEALRIKAAALAQSNSELQADIDQLGSVASVVEIAEEELDLVQPDTVIFQPES